MSRTHPTPFASVRRAFALLAAALAMLLVATAHAQPTSGVQWVQTSLTTPAGELFTPASGALFVRAEGGLMRSNDGGDSWTPVPLPPEPPVPGFGDGWPGSIVVDPVSHTTIYAASPSGLYKTDDDAATWSIVLPPAADYPELAAIAVSPADNRLVYAAQHSRSGNRLRLMRSADAGGSWEIAASREASVHISCDWAVYLLQSHPTDPNRVFLAASCPRSSSYADLEQSTDRGITWARLYESKIETPRSVLVAGSSPGGQLFATLRKDARGGGALLLRSQDDGASWAPLIDFAGGGGMSGGGPDVTLTGLAVDPTRPDRMIVGVNATHATARLDSQVRLSTDAGATWTDTTPPDFPAISDLAFGIDGRTMFAATSSGVWRASAPSR